MHVKLIISIIFFWGTFPAHGELEVNLTLNKCCDFHSHYDVNEGKCVTNEDGKELERLFSEEVQELLERSNTESIKVVSRNNDKTCPPGVLKRIVIDGINASKELFVAELNERLGKNESYYMEQKCLERDGKNFINIIMCNDSKAMAKPESSFPSSMKKCCKFDESVVLREDGSYSCTSYNFEHWNENVNKSLENGGYFSKSYYFSSDTTYGFPKCTKNIKMLNNFNDTWFEIKTDGSVKVGLKFWFRPVWLKAPADLHCVDNFVVNPKTNQIHKNEILFYCELEDFNAYLFHRRLFGGLCVTSSLIILCILIIYVSIWDKQNMAGLTQFFLFTSLFVVFGMEGLRVLVQPNGLLARQTNSCFIVAAIAQYFFFTLSTTWTVMCFDLFWTFWRLESSDVPATKHPKRIFAYFIVSWVLPLIVSVVAFILVNMGSSNTEMGKLSFSHRRCSSAIRELGFTTQGIFFLVNLCFFVCTAIFIYKHQKTMKSAKRSTTTFRTADKTNWASVVLFLKLLVVMGVTSLPLSLDYFFVSLDQLRFFATCIRVIHFLPALAAFYIFGFNQRNVKLLRKKYPTFKRIWDDHSCKKDGLNTSTGTSLLNPTRSEATK